MILLFLSAGMALNGQYTKEFKRIFFDADYLMETGFYEEAFNRYKNLLTLDPGNSNILFHCGACCLNIPGNEKQAITYLEEAGEGVTLNYKAKSHKEPRAPVMAYFMLGQAYHLDYQFEKAIAAYSKYLEVGDDEDEIQLEYARMQMEACERASSIERTHPAFEFQGVLEHFEDDLPSCSNPVISGDGKTLIFLVDYPSDKKIMMTTRTDSIWSRPKVINSQIGMVGETYPVSLSFDGKDLYLMHQFYSHSDIFVSHLKGRRWTEAEDLGYHINGRTSENHASISKDGQTLYFTSDMRGGEGSFDIYVARLNEKGEWDDVANLGPAINTPYEEHTPFISSNDSILFFSSQGHATMGGLDVFHSTLQPDGTWSEPVNIGYPVNTTGNDVFYNPGWNELESYYAIRRADDPTSNTINMVMEIEYPEEELLADVPVAVSTTTRPEEEVTEATLVEPPNTDEIEIVLNEGRPDTQVEPERVEDPVETQVETTAPVVRSALTHELTTLVPFEIDKYRLGFAAQLEVEKIAELMMYYPDSKVICTGHADETADEAYNMRLSYARAEMVAEYLEMRGIDFERIQVEGKGETEPLAVNRFTNGSVTHLGRYLNRQVLVRITGSLPSESRLNGVYIPSNLVPTENLAEAKVREQHFTIQLMAVSTPLPDSYFEGLDVKEYECKDGLYRYTTNSFRTFQEARKSLLRIRQRGYPDAFIQTREWCEQAIR
jgi:outer membrane protein OmpA-like peptidoglycan-associated protein/tetratricopeptide (TPR) repeat protein